MNDALKQAVGWLLLIVIVCYIFDINPVALIGSAVHAGQQMHQANAHH